MKVKQQQKILFKDWKFWFKLLSGLIILGMVFGIYLKEMIELGQLKTDVFNWFKSLDQTNLTLTQFQKQLSDQFGNNSKLNWISIVPILKTEDGKNLIESLKISAGFGEYTIQKFSYFTFLSNVAVGVWFITAALKPQKEGNKGFINYESTLIVVTSITITMLIWLGMLMPQQLISNPNSADWYFWLTGLSQHAVFPLLLILYICLVWNPQKTLTNKEYMKKGWWKLILVLLSYGIYTLIRGELRYQGDRPYDTQYPYFFLRIHESKVSGLPGAAWFVIALTAIIAICLGFSIGYNTIINKKSKKIKIASNIN